MSDDFIRKAFKGNGNGNGNGNGTKSRGRPKGSKNKSKILRLKDETKNSCKELVGYRAQTLTQDILDEETRLAFSDIRGLFFKGDWSLVPPSELPDDVARCISSVQVSVRYIPQGMDAEPIKEVTYKYTFWDKGRALERLSKHLGLYEKDNVQKPPPQVTMILEQGNVQMALHTAQVAVLPGPGNGYDSSDLT